MWAGAAGALLALLSGCCAAEECGCDDARADTIALRFSRDSLTTGFRQAEIDTFFLVRVALDILDRPQRDSVVLTTSAGRAGADIQLDQRGPFATNPRKAAAYRYVVRGVAPDTFTVDLRDIGVSGRFVTTTACCTCYENTRKELRVNRGPLLDQRTPAGAQPAVAELRKP